MKVSNCFALLTILVPALVLLFFTSNDALAGICSDVGNPNRCVERPDIDKDAVNSSKIQNRSIRTRDLGDGIITGRKLGKTLIMAVVVADDGTLVSASHDDITSFQTGTGSYNVVFPKDVTGCYVTGQHNVEAGTLAQSVVVTALINRGGSAETIGFFTWSSFADARENRSFHAIVFCP